MPSTVGVEVPLESLPERPGWRTGRAGREGKDTTDHGNCYLARVLGEIAIDAARTDSFLAERVSAPLENEAIAPLENEAAQTDWLGDLSGGLGSDPAAGR